MSLPVRIHGSRPPLLATTVRGHQTCKTKLTDVSPRAATGGRGHACMMVTGWGSGGEAPRPIRPAQRKILASLGGLEAVSMRKRHYQFGNPRPPNWATFLLNILSLPQKKGVQRIFKTHQLPIQRWDYYGRPTSFFLRRVCPPNRPKCPKKWGFEPGFEPIFFATWRRHIRVSGWCGAPTAAEWRRRKIFTPKAYLHTSFCVQKMVHHELRFRLHRVLFCVRHFGTNASLASPRGSTVLNPVKKLAGRGRSPPSDLAASRYPGDKP